MVDSEGYRPNVGIVLLNCNNEVLWGRRKGESSWQFPQGGIAGSEKPEEAMFRELYEELGLLPEYVQIVGKTKQWLYYDVPGQYNRGNNNFYRGQKQIWYLLKFLGKDHNINVKLYKEPEFDGWRWVDYWLPVEQVVSFKRDVYKKALNELTAFLNSKEAVNE